MYTCSGFGDEDHHTQVSWTTYKDWILHRVAKHHDGNHVDEIDCVNTLVMIYMQVVPMILVYALYIFWNIVWFVCVRVEFLLKTDSLFVCCYKPRKYLLRLPPWARSKTPGSISTRATLFLRSYQRYTTAQNWFVYCWFFVLPPSPSSLPRARLFLNSRVLLFWVRQSECQ